MIGRTGPAMLVARSQERHQGRTSDARCEAAPNQKVRLTRQAPQGGPPTTGIRELMALEVVPRAEVAPSAVPWSF